MRERPERRGSARIAWIPILLAALFSTAACDGGSAANAQRLTEEQKQAIERDIQAIFANKSEANRFFNRQKREKKRFGRPIHIKIYNRKKSGDTVVMQRSGRKRLYDHNIILRGIFEYRVKHKQYGNFAPLFNKAVFIDIGSAILYADGAPTVRDLYEDARVLPHLSKIVATDINDKSNAHTRYIDIYRTKGIRGKKLPFPVEEIPMAITERAQVDKLLVPHSAGDSLPFIMRSTNSGPDLFYSPTQLRAHLRAIIRAGAGRNVIYFFNKFVLFKHASAWKFEVIGTIDESVAIAHRDPRWRYIKWSRRRLTQAFRPDRRYMSILSKQAALKEKPAAPAPADQSAKP